MVFCVVLKWFNFTKYMSWSLQFTTFMKHLFFATFICFVFIQLDLQFYVISFNFFFLKIFISSMIYIWVIKLQANIVIYKSWPNANNMPYAVWIVIYNISIICERYLWIVIYNKSIICERYLSSPNNMYSVSSISMKMLSLEC